MRGLGLAICALAVGAVVDGPATASHRSIDATAYVNYTGSETSCPNPMKKNLETRKVRLPHPGETVTENWSGTYPRRCSPAWGVDFSEALPINVSKVVNVSDPVCSAQECAFDTQLVLTAEPFCECTAIHPKVKSITVGDPDRKGRTHLKLSFKYAMKCSGGRTGDCKGRLHVNPPDDTDIKLRRDVKRSVNCDGECNRSMPPVKTTAKGTTRRFDFVSRRDLAIDNRRSEKFRFVIDATCLGGLPGEGQRDVESTTVTIAFGPQGFTNRGASDLDGDGERDGRGG